MNGLKQDWTKELAIADFGMLLPKFQFPSEVTKKTLLKVLFRVEQVEDKIGINLPYLVHKASWWERYIC